MKENKLVDLSVNFVVPIINLVKYLTEKHKPIISSQIGRGGASIRVNIREVMLFFSINTAKENMK